MRWILVFLLWIVWSAFWSAKSVILHATTQSLHSIAHSKLVTNYIAQDSILFSNPVINFCLGKDNNLLMIDGSREKIFSIDLSSKRWANVETMLLPQKINFVKGIAADGIYIYLYTENSLYRFDQLKAQLVFLISPKDRIKINDLTITTEGEIFVSDGLNNQILIMNSLGKISMFNKPSKDLFVPTNIFYDLEQSQLLVLNQAQNRVEIYSRIGNLSSVIPIPKMLYTKLVKYQHRFIILQNNCKSIDQIIDGKVNSFFESSRPNITNFLIYNKTLFVLDGSKGIYQYPVQF